MQVNTTSNPSAQSRPLCLMPFGRFKGSPLSDLPSDYLLWLSMLPDVRQPLLGGLLAEMARRIVEADRQTGAMPDDAGVEHR